jgi:hypothetical protein
MTQFYSNVRPNTVLVGQFRLMNLTGFNVITLFTNAHNKLERSSLTCLSIL